MKTIIMRTEKSSRWGAMLLATVVAIITCLAVASATQTITTPNAAFITYNLAAGTSSAVITPATNRAVLVMGCCTTVGFGAAGQVSLFHAPSDFIAWAGLESPVNSTITSGVVGSPNHIVFIDQLHQVDIKVAGPDTILIHNGATATRAGNVTLIW